MRRTLLAIGLAVLASYAAAPKTYDVVVKDYPGIRGGPPERILELSFYQNVPQPQVVDKILRESLEHAIAVDASRDILAMAFLGEEALTSTQYSGELVYRAAQRKIMTLDESRGVKTTAIDAAPVTHFAVATATPAPTVTPVRNPEMVTITQPISIPVKYGSAGVAAGTKLPFVSRAGDKVRVRYYDGADYDIPVEATDLK